MAHLPCCWCECRVRSGSNVLDPGAGNRGRVCMIAPVNPADICCAESTQCRCADVVECEADCAGCPCELTLSVAFMTNPSCDPVEQSCDIAATLTGHAMCIAYRDDAGNVHGFFCGWYFLNQLGQKLELPCPQGAASCAVNFWLWLEPDPLQGIVAKYHWGTDGRFRDDTIETIEWSGCTPRNVILPVTGNVCCCCDWDSAILSIPECN